MNPQFMFHARMSYNQEKVAGSVVQPHNYLMAVYSNISENGYKCLCIETEAGLVLTICNHYVEDVKTTELYPFQSVTVTLKPS